MRLKRLVKSRIRENTTRRQFLRGASAAVASTNPIGQLFKSALGSKASLYDRARTLYKRLNSETKDAVRHFMFDMYNTSGIDDVNNFKLGNTYVKDGIVHYAGKKFPIQAVLGKDLVETDFSDPYSITSNWFTGEYPDIINKLAPGITNDILQVALKQHGSKPIMAELSSLGAETDSYEPIWTTVLQHPTFRKIVGMGPKEFLDAFNDPKQLHKLVRSGAVDKDSARAHAEYLQSKLQRDEEDDDDEEDELEHITPRSDDFIYGSSMHQPLENLHRRLTAILC